MSDTSHASAWYPPPFPLGGRLPHSPDEVERNLYRREDLQRAYHNELSRAKGRRVSPPCCKTLYVTLCFDGTGNNLNHDLYVADRPHPSNIVRMFSASIGVGSAGGTGHNATAAQALTDTAGTGSNQYFKYYIPGVGTPFGEIGELDYSLWGQGMALYGEERINWALLMVVDALRRMLGLPKLDNAEVQESVKLMSGALNGRIRRRHEFARQLGALYRPLKIALTHPHPGHPKLTGIKLYIYGFSRGAAAARAFVTWLDQLLAPSATPALKLLDLELPISVDYLGLMDTVGSVGIPDIVPGANGHLSWADGTQELPQSALVKRCLHLVAGHEQRLCFPLESIRRPGGEYPANSVEVVYPGVHSDVGGGYLPGDQGKAVSENDGSLLSQLGLHDIYADAFVNGAPLKVPIEALPVHLKEQLWRSMGPGPLNLFAVSVVSVSRFNAWRSIAVGQEDRSQQSRLFDPVLAGASLENLLRESVQWITAWRIDRYAFSSLTDAPFYMQASNTHAQPEELASAKKKHHSRQLKIRQDRFEQSLSQRHIKGDKPPLPPGLPDFDPDIAQTQLREAANEFAEEYRTSLGPSAVAIQVARWAIIPGLLLYQYTEAARAERLAMKQAGMAKVSQLFPPPVGYYRNHVDENKRILVDEARNAAEATGLLRALFDDQVHDSRAWFLYSLGREIGGSYFAERMVFFGHSDRRELAVYTSEQSHRLLDTDPSRLIPQPVAPSLTEEERLADLHRRLKNIWDAPYSATEQHDENV